MNNEKLILRALNYLLWVHQPRSDISGQFKDELMVDLTLAINPINNERVSEDLPKEERRETTHRRITR